jgi:hypothetical protein
MQTQFTPTEEAVKLADVTVNLSPSEPLIIVGQLIKDSDNRTVAYDLCRQLIAAFGLPDINICEPMSWQYIFDLRSYNAVDNMVY